MAKALGGKKKGGIMLHRMSLYWVLVFLCFLHGRAGAQSFVFTAIDTVLSGPLGSELVFNCTMTNISSSPITLAMVRRLNNLPADWQSSMCFDLCFAPFVDSIATTSAFGSSPLAAGVTRPFSVHVVSANNQGAGIVRVVVKDITNPSDNRTVTFGASTISEGVRTSGAAPPEYFLSQNYPNPWNPTTNIVYSIAKSGHVSLNVYNLLGQEVTRLVDKDLTPGSYTVEFSGAHFSSGLYLYRLTSGDYTQTRTMALAK